MLCGVCRDTIMPVLPSVDSSIFTKVMTPRFADSPIYHAMENKNPISILKAIKQSMPIESYDQCLMITDHSKHETFFGKAYNNCFNDSKHTVWYGSANPIFRGLHFSTQTKTVLKGVELWKKQKSRLSAVLV